MLAATPLPWRSWGHAVARTLCATVGLALWLNAHAAFKPAAKASAPEAKAAPRAPRPTPKVAHKAPVSRPGEAAPAARSSAQCADLTTQLSLGVEALTPAEMRYLKEHCQLAASPRKHP